MGGSKSLPIFIEVRKVFQYVLCFCITPDKDVLMQQRKFGPHRGRWSGISGTIEVYESPFQCAKRELFEETSMSIEILSFAGVVTWTENQKYKGMYVFIANIQKTFEGVGQSEEGALRWWPIEWVLESDYVVDNIRHFLPKMLESTTPWEYYCDYKNNKFHKLLQRPFPLDVKEG